MTEQFDDAAYRERVIQGVLAAVVQAGAVEGSGGGMIALDSAIESLCDAIASIEAASGVSATPSDRRKTADHCRQRIIRTGSGLAAMTAAGQPLPWTFEAIGPRN